MENRETILNVIKNIILDKQNLEPKEIVGESNLFYDIGMDSIYVVELSIELEKHYDITIFDSDIENAETIDDIINIVTEKLN